MQTGDSQFPPGYFYLLNQHGKYGNSQNDVQCQFAVNIPAGETRQRQHGDIFGKRILCSLCCVHRSRKVKSP